MDIKKIFYAQGVTYELTRGVILFIIFIILINYFIVTIHVVQGESMEPNFSSNQFIITNKISYLIDQPRRGDVVVLKFPGDPDKQKYIKRIIGLPGEKLEIKNSEIYINNQKLIESYISENINTYPDMIITMNENEYFVIGDNRPNSSDSRIWGKARKNDFIGKGFFRLNPWGFLAPVYYNI